MSALRSIQIPDAPLSPKDLFLAADYDAVVAMLAGRPRAPEDDILLTRTHIRLGQFDNAERILNASPVRDMVRGLILRADIDVCRGTLDAADVFLNDAEPLPKNHEESEYFRYMRAMVAYCRLDTARAEELLRSPIHSIHQRANELRGLIFMRKQQYRKAVEMFLRAANGPDQRIKYNALCNASFMARELYLPDAMAQIEALAVTEPPRHLARFQMHIMRASAWFLALEGKFAKALRRFRDAARFAATDPWKIAVLGDRGYISLCFGESENGWDDIEEALTIAREINWEQSQGEERRVLLMLASALADRRTDDARWCLERYFSLEPTDGWWSEWSRDVRSLAFENYARGCVARAEGHSQDAHKFFAEAFKVFHTVGYHWRAVLTLLARRQSIYSPLEMSEYIETVLRDYPNSWLRSLVETQTQIHCDPVEFDSLTTMERKVLDLMLDGKRNRDIAKQLARKECTIAGHITRIFQKLDCSSRGEVISRYAVVQVS